MKTSRTGMTNKDYAANFDDFLGQVGKGQPFCFWLGTHEPHRGFEEAGLSGPSVGGAGLQAHQGGVSLPWPLPCRNHRAQG